METVLKAISDWIKSLLTAAIMSNLSGLFDDVNTQVGSIAQQVGTKPSSFEPRVFAMIEALSQNVVLPIAGIILTFIACYVQHGRCIQVSLYWKDLVKSGLSVKDAIAPTAFAFKNSRTFQMGGIYCAASF